MLDYSPYRSGTKYHFLHSGPFGHYRDFISWRGKTSTTSIRRSKIFEAMIEMCNANSSSISAAVPSSRA